jgi:hypothetical protein
MFTFKELADMYHKGLLTPELRKSIKKDLLVKEKIDKQKFFQTKDGRKINLIELQENLVDKDTLFMAKLPNKPERK